MTTNDYIQIRHSLLFAQVLIEQEVKKDESNELYRKALNDNRKSIELLKRSL
jgi:hypothetical protein